MDESCIGYDEIKRIIYLKKWIEIDVQVHKMHKEQNVADYITLHVKMNGLLRLAYSCIECMVQ